MTTNNPGYDGPTPEHYFKAIEAQRDALQARLDRIAGIMGAVTDGDGTNPIRMEQIDSVYALATGQEVWG